MFEEWEHLSFLGPGPLNPELGLLQGAWQVVLRRGNPGIHQGGVWPGNAPTRSKVNLWTPLGWLKTALIQKLDLGLKSRKPHILCLLTLLKPRALLELLAEEATLPMLASRQGRGLESSKDETVGASDPTTL